jgi:hypothetical protein
MNLANSPSSDGFRMKQLPFSAYTCLTNSGSSAPAATTIGMCINEGVDLMIFKTPKPVILVWDKSKNIRSGIASLAYFPSRSTYMSASGPSWTQCRPLVSPATLKASTVSTVSAGLLCTTSTSSCLGLGRRDLGRTDRLETLGGEMGLLRAFEVLDKFQSSFCR